MLLCECYQGSQRLLLFVCIKKRPSLYRVSKLGSAEYQFIKKTVTQLFLLARLLRTPIYCWREVTWLCVISLLAISAAGAGCLKAECGNGRVIQELSGHLLCSLGPTTFVFPRKEMLDEKKAKLDRMSFTFMSKPGRQEYMTKSP